MERIEGNCPDCWAKPREIHDPGCDVTRCSECGFQLLSCGCPEGEPLVWDNYWPGDKEVEKYRLEDLNELYTRAVQGLLVWDRDTHEWKLPA